MVDDRDDLYDGQEEGEYHFSDDQINYDLENEAPKPAAPVTTSSSSFKDSILAKLKQNRRVIFGAVAFVVLIGVIYKMVLPTGKAPSTEFAQNSVGETPTARRAAPEQARQPTAPVTQAQQQAPQEQSLTGMVTAEQQAAAQQQQPAAPVQNQAYNGGQQQPLNPMQQAQATMPQQGGQYNQAPEQPAPSADQQTQNVVERLAALEQQNAALVNLLQTEYAQKMADYETQNTATRGKLEEVTKRLNRMETSLNQISQMLEGRGGGGGSPAVMSRSGNSMESMDRAPKMTYSVQAIIPGRAWLKSESGDTVTVAEGDFLRSYGRVTKIDPYDGIVNIDTGNKVITLSYGISAD